VIALGVSWGWMFALAVALWRLRRRLAPLLARAEDEKARK
jgi:hypothetical protein